MSLPSRTNIFCIHIAPESLYYQRSLSLTSIALLTGACVIISRCREADSIFTRQPQTGVIILCTTSSVSLTRRYAAVIFC